MVDNARIRRIKARTEMLVLYMQQDELLAGWDIEKLKLYSVADIRFLLETVDRLWMALGCRNADVVNLKMLLARGRRVHQIPRNEGVT